MIQSPPSVSFHRLQARAQLRTIEKGLARWWWGELFKIPVGHGGEYFDRAMTLFDGDAELHAFDQATQALG